MANTLDYLIQELHDAQLTKDNSRIIAIELKLAEYHYNNSNFNKTKMFLNSILKKKKDLENIYYYLALIDINENKINSAIKNLDKELKINPNNIQAMSVREKLEIHTNFPIITVYLFIINLIFFIFVFPKLSLIESIQFGISNFNFSFFSALTSLFFHINIFHFILNMIILVIFGPILEKGIGSIKFLLIYLVSGLIGNIFQALFSIDSIVIGASGALFGILGSLMMREPLLKLRLFGIIKAPIILILALFFSISVIESFIFQSEMVSGNLSHIIGMFIGIFITGILFRERIKIFYNWIFIVSGFWLITYIFNYWRVYGIQFNFEFLFELVIIFFSILVITYSYVHLKVLEEFKNE